MKAKTLEFFKLLFNALLEKETWYYGLWFVIMSSSFKVIFPHTEHHLLGLIFGSALIMSKLHILLSSVLEQFRKPISSSKIMFKKLIQLVLYGDTYESTGNVYEFLDQNNLELSYIDKNLQLTKSITIKSFIVDVRNEFQPDGNIDKVYENLKIKYQLS